MTKAVPIQPSPPLDALVAGVIDYAGLFPPANLPMGDMVRNFAAYRAGSQADLLGRCVVPLARLPEFEKRLAELPLSERSGWRLSALGTQDPSADWSIINAFNCRHVDARIVSVEVKAASPAEITALAQIFPPVIEAWVEIPAERASTDLLAALAGANRGAKLRTGGTTPEAFPAADSIAHFLSGCHRAGVVAKATAGLHHPLSGMHPLSYETGAPLGSMFGFINVVLAAALTRKGALAEEVTTLLLDRDPVAFHSAPAAFSWRDHTFSTAELEATRRSLLRSFGSCSFTEPIDGLKTLGWI